MTLHHKHQVPGWCCPYCAKPVCYIGVFAARLVGAALHDCDFSNVEPPMVREAAASSK